MGRFRYRGVKLTIAILSFWGLAACGGKSKAGPPLFAGRISLTPGNTLSLVLGGTQNFTASVQTTTGTTLNTAISFSSSDTSILNIAANGAACAGHWDAAFTTCTPGNVGLVQVTATALGGASVPTYVFVHPPVDSITVTGLLVDGLPVQEPCLSQSQSMTLEAHAYSQGTDVTQLVGPFTWSSNNTAVVTLTPFISNNNYNFATNQVTARANTPGITHIFASANGVTSSSFQQPQYTNSQNQPSPVLDFFATCAIQNISLELGAVGSGQTSFSVTKGSSSGSVTALATVTDIMGNSSLPNTNGGVVLSKIPLTWSASQPGSINAGTSCTQSCSLALAAPGSGTVTASCSPPTCNAGFPEIPTAFLTNGKLDPVKVGDCTTFFQAEFPDFAGCQGLIPVPVYSSPVFIKPPTNIPTNSIPLTPIAAISGVVMGTPGSASVLAASTGCAHEPPASCTSAAYFVSTAKAVPGGENPLPVPPNSFLFDAAGDKVFMGSDFGALVINPANFGSSSSPYTSLGTVTGRILATNHNGSVAVFSDTLHSPNQVYVVTAGVSSGPTALNIPAASTAAISPDGLKTFIAGGSNGTQLYIYSSLQALQQFSPTTPPTNPQLSLAQPADAIAFSPNGAFAFVAESAADASAANLTAFSTCDNTLAGTLSLPAFSLPAPRFPNLIMRVLPNLHLDGRDSLGNTIPDGIHIAVLDSTGFDLVTATVSAPVAGSLCPQQLTFKPVQRIEMGQGLMQPLNFFVSGDGTQLYVVNSGASSIVAYNLIAAATVGGIELAGGATPLSADSSVDGGTILISGSDGMLHEVTTQGGGLDLVQLSFPNLPNYYNAFCTITPSAGPCILNAALAKP